MQARLTRAVLWSLGSGALMVLSLFGSKGIENGSAALAAANPSAASGDVHGAQLADNDCGCTAVGGVRG